MRSLVRLSAFAGLLGAALVGIGNANAATLVVTNTADSGTGSLRDTIAAAGDGDTIQFDPALNGQTISLTTAELGINKNITISGPGPDLLNVSRAPGAPEFGIFHILPGHTVALQSITISGGLTGSFSGSGGGVFNDQATLAIDNCTVSNNRAGVSGGGIDNTGTLNIGHSLVSNNTVTYYGGGISNDAGGLLTITDTSVSNNTATGAGHLGAIGGGISHTSSGMLTIRNSNIDGNGAAGDGTQGSTGGGIYSTGPLTIIDSRVATNGALASAGGIYHSGTTTITHSTISQNGASIAGGGIYGISNVTITDSTVSGNHAGIDFFFYGDGGGIYHAGGTLTILSSTISDNRADGGTKGSHGGGVYSEGGGPVVIGNSTFSGNFARNDGGAISNESPLTINSCTFSANSSNGAAGGIVTGGTDVLCQIGNTILKAGNSGANLVSSGSGTIISLGYNLSSDDGGGFLTAPGDQINADPILGPLQDNGGPTFTHELLTGSPAINAGDPVFTPPPDFDQRGAGYPRVFNGRIDIGSFELQIIAPTPTPTPTTPTPTPTVTPCADDFVFEENFDGVTAPALPAGWSAANVAGGAPLWVTSTSTPDTPPNDAFIDDPATVSDKRLDTFDIPIGGPGVQVFFRNFYDLQSSSTPGVGFDGGVLEVSSPYINAGAFTDITDAAVGGSFITGGYNRTISKDFMSPIAGRMAWSGNSGGYINTLANLGPNVVGNYIKLRFRMASDNNGSATGWRVDNVRVIVNCQIPSPTPTASCPPIITQSSTQTLTTENSFACHNGVGHADNSYWRAFNMGTFVGGESYNVTSVSFGVESANNTQPVTVRLYTNSGGPFPGGTRTQIAASTIDVTSAQSGTVVTTPLVATVPAGTSELVMELFTPNGETSGNLFIVGSNVDPQTGLSYLSATDCGITMPTDTAALGYPNMHIVFTVNGFCEGTPTPTATATATVPTSTPTPTPFFVRVFWEGFDAVTAPALPAGWGTSFTPGPANCTPTGTCALGTDWATSAATSQTAPNAAFHDAPGCVTDSILDTPSIFIPKSFYPSVMYFWQNYDLEAGHDGGVLEISIDGGAFTDIVAAGGQFFGGDYNDTISTAFLSPIAGRQAWTGSSGGYIYTTVSLPLSAMGHNVVLRFRVATDCSVAGTGWYVDSLTIAYFNDVHFTPTPTPTPPTPTPTPTPPSPTPTPTLTPTPTPPPTPTPSPTPSPTPATQAVNLSTRMLVQTGDNVGIGGFIITGSTPKHVLIRGLGPSLAAFGITDALADPTLDLRAADGSGIQANDNWRDTQEAEIEATGIPPQNDLEAAIAATLSPGSYTAILRGRDQGTGVGLVEIYDLNHEVDSKLANLSTRAFVDTGNHIVIAGFTLGGNGAGETIVVRGIGPSLTAFGVTNALANPTLELRDSNGALLISNNDWQDNPAQAAELIAAGLAPTHQLESGIVMMLPPGLYTALLAGLNDGTGLGLVEVYDNGSP